MVLRFWHSEIIIPEDIVLIVLGPGESKINAIHDLLKNSKDIDPEIRGIITDRFYDMI